MNNAQVIGMRQMNEMASLASETKTAREMALEPHSLNRAGDIARQAGGKLFRWDEKRGLWVRFA